MTRDQANTAAQRALTAALPANLPGHWDTADGRDMAARYADQTRADLCMSEVSDLALANAAFMELHEPLGSATKERMRWLSVHLALARQALAALEAQGVLQCMDCNAKWSAALEAKDAEIERLNERLENNRVFNAEGHRIDVAPGSVPDGIECRDETIRQQEANLETMRTNVRHWREEVGKKASQIARLSYVLRACIGWIEALAKSGDAGFWDAEDMPEIQAARAALAQVNAPGAEAAQ